MSAPSLDDGPVEVARSPFAEVAGMFVKNHAAVAALVVLVAVGVALLTLSAKLKIPFYPVPITLQTLATGLVGLLLPPGEALACMR